ncbi:MAG: hypothetical protein GTN73_01750 [Candidatus Aminicenantes bacterium]|nr:hypothetical protein [Candidatus Aminicenantes bacterium]
MLIELAHRVQGILLKPREEWIKIKEEFFPLISQLYSSYVLILAAFPPVIGFLANLLYGGFRKPYSGWSWNVAGKNFLFSIVTYIFSLIVVYVIGRIINVLAPIFASRRSNLDSLKLAVYSLTPYWIGGVSYLVPRGGWVLRYLVAFYGIYILYSGFAASLMKTPKEKVLKYLAVSGILAIVLIAGVEIILRILFAAWGVLRVA